MSLVFNLLVYSPKNTCVSVLYSYSIIWGKVWLPGAWEAEKNPICYIGDELPNRTGGRKCLEWVTSLLFSVSEIPSPLSHVINGIFSSLIFCLFMWFFTPTLIDFKMFTCVLPLRTELFPLNRRWLWQPWEFKAYPSQFKAYSLWSGIRHSQLDKFPEQICNVACDFCSGNQISLSHGIRLQECWASWRQVLCRHSNINY